MAGEFKIRWYGLAYMAGFVVAWLLVRWLAKTKRSSIPFQAVGDLVLYAIVGVIVGGRLGYVLFYNPEAITDFSGRFPFWEVLALWHGGMSSHGGIAGVVIAGWIFARRRGLSVLHLLDVAAFVTPPGLFFGRLANFINGELWGRPLPESMQANPPWWSIKYPEEVRDWPAERLVELSRAAEAVGVPASQWREQLAHSGSSREARLRVGETIDRMVEAMREGNETVTAVFESLRPMLTAFYPSQLFQALAEGVLLFAILAIVWLRPRKPGVVGSWFLIAYGVLRVTTEQFRQPDEGLALLLNVLTRGQVLSILMVLAGVAMLIWSARQPWPRTGGLLRRASE